MSTELTAWEALSGQYRLHPGTALSIVGQRPVLGAGRLGSLLRGQRGSEVSRTLSSVFTLCAHAHRRTAELALAAAQAGSQIPVNVQLDADGRVRDYRVLAPTEWNFHPEGALAHALAAAFDPCVVCTV